MIIKKEKLESIKSFINPNEEMKFKLRMGIAATGFEFTQGQRHLILSWNDFELAPNEKDHKHAFGNSVKLMRKEILDTITSVTTNYTEATEDFVLKTFIG